MLCKLLNVFFNFSNFKLLRYFSVYQLRRDTNVTFLNQHNKIIMTTVPSPEKFLKSCFSNICISRVTLSQLADGSLV